MSWCFSNRIISILVFFISTVGLQVEASSETLIKDAPVKDPGYDGCSTGCHTIFGWGHPEEIDQQDLYDQCMGDQWIGCDQADAIGNFQDAGIDSNFFQCLNNCLTNNCSPFDACFASCQRAYTECGSRQQNQNCPDYSAAGYKDPFVCCPLKFVTVPYPGLRVMARYGDVDNNNSNGFFMVPFVIVQCPTNSCYVQEPSWGGWFAFDEIQTISPDWWCDGGQTTANMKNYTFRVKDSAPSDLIARIKIACEGNGGTNVVNACSNPPAACQNFQKGILAFSVGIKGTQANQHHGNIKIIYVHAPNPIDTTDLNKIASNHLKLTRLT